MIPSSLPDNSTYFYSADAMGLDPTHDVLISVVWQKNYRIDMHLHDFAEINIVTGGEGVHYIENHSYRISKGDVFIIPPSVKHGFFPNGGLDVFHILIHEKFFFEYETTLKQLPSYYAMFNTEPYIRARTGFSMLAKLDEAGTGEMSFIAETLEKLKRDEEFAERNTTMNSLVMYCISRLAYFYRDYHEKLGGEFQANKTVNLSRSIEYIHENYEKSISIDTLASLCNLSRSAFYDSFRRQFNIPPRKYINLYRIEKAEVLLKYSDLTITEVAMTCGFYDCSHFIRTFRREMGTSPDSYRSKIKTNKESKQ